MLFLPILSESYFLKAILFYAKKKNRSLETVRNEKIPKPTEQRYSRNAASKPSTTTIS